MDYKGSTQTDIKLDNQKMIFAMLFEHGAMTRAELSKALKSSKPTVSKNVGELLQSRRIIEVGKEETTVGKKGILLDINPDYQYVMAVDLSKDSFCVVVANLRGEWLFKKSVQVEKVYAVEALYTYLNQCFKKISQKISVETLAQVVISYPGVADQNETYFLTNVQDKEVLLYNVKSFLCEKGLTNICVKNDINLAALGEKQYGLFREKANMILLSAHTGVGMGIILDHKLYEGERNAAGEIGFILPRKEQDGKYYTLEERVGLQSICQRYQRMTGKESTFHQIKAYLENGQERHVQNLYDEILEELAVAITNVALVLDIQTVMLVGHVFDLKKTMVQDVQQRVNSMAPITTNLYRSTIDYGSLKGAILVGIQHVIEA